MRVLVVDDALEHAEMVVDFLRSGGAWPEAEFYTVSTYDDAIRKCCSCQATPTTPLCIAI